MRWNGAGIALFGMIAGPVFGQSMNIDFGAEISPSPTADYFAAGLPGTWTTITGAQGTMFTDFAKLDGSPASGVTMNNIGGTALVAVNNPDTQGDDERLLDEYLETTNPALEVCLFFHGLENGTYEVNTYGWLPNLPLKDSYVTVDLSGDAPQFVGGRWRGDHALGLTYSLHSVEVTNGDLYMHSGIPPSTTGSAALNGVQLRKISPTTPADLDGDGDVDSGDYAGFASCWNGPGLGVDRSVCLAVDDDGDEDVDLRDYAEFQQLFTGSD